MRKELINIEIQALHEKIAKKHVEDEQCRHHHSFEYCHHITIKIAKLHKELEEMYKLYKSTTGDYHMEDIPF